MRKKSAMDPIIREPPPCGPNCPKRTPACQDHCPDLKAWRDKIHKINHDRQEYEQISLLADKKRGRYKG